MPTSNTSQPTLRLRTRLLVALGALGTAFLQQNPRAGAQDEPKTECLELDANAQCPSDDQVIETLQNKHPDYCTPIFDPPGSTIVDNTYCCYQVRYDCSAQVVGCACFMGHPLLIEGRPLEGGTRAQQGWKDARLPLPDLSGLSMEQRQLLALHWARIGAAEYVSIAGFQRLVMDLMVHGAEPSLIHKAQRAAMDETRHARMAFSLASAFAGTDIGPSSLDLPGAIPIHRSLRELAMTCAEEGCVVETLSAFLIGEMVELATDPAVVGVLKRMKRDEERHAALAWEILGWALRRDGRMLEAVQEALEGAIKRVGIQGFAHSAGVEAYGLLGVARAEAAKKELLQGVVRPCWEALRAALGS